MPSPQQAQIDLASVPLLAGVEDLALAMGAAEWLYFYRDGESICVQGARADYMIVILSGDSFLVTRIPAERLTRWLGGL